MITNYFKNNAFCAHLAGLASLKTVKDQRTTQDVERALADV
jgi:hypothetical protein